MNGGETWSSWYNQPTAQMYHVIGRQRVSLSGLRRTAGERFGLRGQPRQRWRDHVSRLASGGRGRIRLRGARSARSGFGVWRETDTLMTGAPGKRPKWGRSRCADLAIVCCARSQCCFRRLIRTCFISQPIPSGRRAMAASTGRRSVRIFRARPGRFRPAWANIATRRAPSRRNEELIYALAPSPLDIERLWAGTDDGLIHVDDGWRVCIGRM